MSVLARAGVAPALVAALIAAAPAASASTTALRPDERRARALVNRARDDHDLASLQASASLSKTARKHSRAMANEGDLFHRDDLTAGLNGITWSLVGENVGTGSTVRSIHRAFMNSAPHRHNILNHSFDTVGVGVVEGEGRMWVTLVFLG